MACEAGAGLTDELEQGPGEVVQVHVALHLSRQLSHSGYGRVDRGLEARVLSCESSLCGRLVRLGRCLNNCLDVGPVQTRESAYEFNYITQKTNVIGVVVVCRTVRIVCSCTRAVLVARFSTSVSTY